MGPCSSLACSRAKCFISSTLRLVSFSFGARSSMDCRAGDGGKCGLERAHSGGHQWPWALRRPAKALPNQPPTWSWPLPRMLRKATPIALHPCLPSLSVSSLLCALYSDFHKNTSTYTLYQLAWVEVTNDLHVAKSKGQFSILTKLDPSAALTAPNSPSSSQLWSLVLPGHRPLLVLL